jgi:hypothetical protein
MGVKDVSSKLGRFRRFAAPGRTTLARTSEDFAYSPQQ